MKNFSELSAQAAALEREHDYEAANKLWSDAAKVGNDKQKGWAELRAQVCTMAITREWA